MIGENEETRRFYALISRIETGRPSACRRALNGLASKLRLYEITCRLCRCPSSSSFAFSEASFSSSPGAVVAAPLSSRSLLHEAETEPHHYHEEEEDEENIHPGVNRIHTSTHPPFSSSSLELRRTGDVEIASSRDKDLSFMKKEIKSKRQTACTSPICSSYRWLHSALSQALFRLIERYVKKKKKKVLETLRKEKNQREKNRHMEEEEEERRKRYGRDGCLYKRHNTEDAEKDEEEEEDPGGQGENEEEVFFQGLQLVKTLCHIDPQYSPSFLSLGLIPLLSSLLSLMNLTESHGEPASAALSISGIEDRKERRNLLFTSLITEVLQTVMTLHLPSPSSSPHLFSQHLQALPFNTSTNQDHPSSSPPPSSASSFSSSFPSRGGISQLLSLCGHERLDLSPSRRGLFDEDGRCLGNASSSASFFCPSESSSAFFSVSCQYNSLSVEPPSVSAHSYPSHSLQQSSPPPPPVSPPQSTLPQDFKRITSSSSFSSPFGLYSENLSCQPSDRSCHSGANLVFLPSSNQRSEGPACSSSSHLSPCRETHADHLHSHSVYSSFPVSSSSLPSQPFPPPTPGRDRPSSSSSPSSSSPSFLGSSSATSSLRPFSHSSSLLREEEEPFPHQSPLRLRDEEGLHPKIKTKKIDGDERGEIRESRVPVILQPSMHLLQPYDENTIPSALSSLERISPRHDSAISSSLTGRGRRGDVVVPAIIHDEGILNSPLDTSPLPTPLHTSPRGEEEQEKEEQQPPRMAPNHITSTTSYTSSSSTAGSSSSCQPSPVSPSSCQPSPVCPSSYQASPVCPSSYQASPVSPSSYQPSPVCPSSCSSSVCLDHSFSCQGPSSLRCESSLPSSSSQRRTSDGLKPSVVTAIDSSSFSSSSRLSVSPPCPSTSLSLLPDQIYMNSYENSDGGPTSSSPVTSQSQTISFSGPPRSNFSSFSPSVSSASQAKGTIDASIDCLQETPKEVSPLEPPPPPPPHHSCDDHTSSSSFSSSPFYVKESEAFSPSSLYIRNRSQVSPFDVSLYLSQRPSDAFSTHPSPSSIQPMPFASSSSSLRPSEHPFSSPEEEGRGLRDSRDRVESYLFTDGERGLREDIRHTDSSPWSPFSRSEGHLEGMRRAIGVTKELQEDVRRDRRRVIAVEEETEHEGRGDSSSQGMTKEGRRRRDEEQGREEEEHSPSSSRPTSSCREALMCSWSDIRLIQGIS
ncbi:hypothetical protein CSUI_003073 [Cystoisospora suis]|uniref:Uncharacterized protein n=1 Tax=Cystoisospora suis TaxID=483139 RepID=A0A2C6L6T4_9APIC|nr:hypothetical protein CSUI_003073 [Cystoisospora suis]